MEIPESEINLLERVKNISIIEGLRKGLEKARELWHHQRVEFVGGKRYLQWAQAAQLDVTCQLIMYRILNSCPGECENSLELLNCVDKDLSDFQVIKFVSESEHSLRHCDWPTV